MRQSQVLRHFQVQANQLFAGDLDQFADMFALPLPIHFPGGLTVVHGADCGGAFLQQMRSEFLDRGVVALRPVISAIDLPRAGRFRVWIEWMEVSASGAETPGSTIVYYCRHCALGLRTEMMQYTHLSSPGLVAAPPRMTRSA